MSYQSNYHKRPAPNGGGGRTHPPSQRFNNEQRSTELKVLTNQNRLLPMQTSDTSDYKQYGVTIKNAFWKRIKDETTGEETSREFEVREITDEDMEKFARKPMAWRIMKKLAEENKVDVAYNGNNMAYSPSATSGPEVGEEYRVKVKRDCEENDPDSERVRDRWFSVTFQDTKSIRFADVEAVMLRGEEASSEQPEEITNMLHIIVNSAAILTDGMISLETNSPAVFFPLHEQQGLLNRKALIETRDKTKILLSGLQMTVNSQKGRGTYVQTESVVKYSNKEHFEVFQADQRHRAGERVPLLNISRYSTTIAGIRIDPHRPVPDASKRAIEEAIGRMSVNIEYTFNKPGKEGSRLYKNKSVRKDRAEDSSGLGKKIIWSACDEAQYSFEVDGQLMTVASFFKNAYGIILKYPQMPIIYIDNIGRGGRGGWLPIELAYQAFEKSKENNEEIVTNILKYHDAIAGNKYINEVELKLNKLSIAGGEGANFRDRLKKWRIEIGNRAVEQTASCLKAPQIKFKTGVARANNGSFGLMGVKFSRPAKLTSFVVVNFTNDKRSCHDFVKTVMRVAKGHGIDIPSMIMDISQNDEDLDRVTVHYNGRDAVGDAMDTACNAIQMAKNFHLYDSNNYYKERNVFFQTDCFSEQEVGVECLVLPPSNNDHSLGLLLDYNNKESKRTTYFSHRIVTKDGNTYDVRLMVKISCTNSLIDPLDFRFQNGRNQACRRDGTWKDVSFVGHCYLCPESNSEFVEHDIQSKQFLHLAKDHEVDFSSMMFVYKPDDDKALYNRIKVVSNCFGGVQSQCAVMKKFEGQGKRKDQYASNIATKMNAKLSTIYDKAVSWTSMCDGGSGDDQLPWVGDVPTMVIGVGMVHGMGKSAKSIVATSLCLDSGCMRLSLSCFIQKKSEKNSDIISVGVMKDIIKGSIERYVIENNCNPERLLFHRDGLSDGNFSMAYVEIESIKEAVEEKLGHGIPVTFVICQSQQLGFRMVPSVPTVNHRGKTEANVPSGTVLEGPKSFYIIPQGGMKGTSKPVKHIVLLNENEEPRNGNYGLTMQNLINCTYQMCWKYPSATKAVRELPTIKYAKKLANQVLSSLLCLEAGVDWFGKYIRLVCPVDDTATENEMRPYLEVRNDQGAVMFPEQQHYNIVQMPFRNHLAA
eukprot:CAMPEP_0172307988 /NCGR_PEP_ID=MMETSP1058-20130122/8723_1 /TAXON_ID=83371 /ORGANISM="Detonula confervacea, Strain CCMP 353" /LENGTH=1152 /DNA_ID=CAMNT_0013020311 /DNA_START=101 /DNA_END=3559 /DNA_ORIENTATION=-